MKKYTLTTKHLKSFLLGGLLIFLLVASVVVYQLSQRTQDLRQQASIDDGIVTISSFTQPATVNSPSTITMAIDTESSQVSGVQLAFTLQGEFASEPTVALLSTSGLGEVGKTIEQVGNSYNVRLIAIPGPGQPFTAAQPIDFLTVTFTPISDTPIALSFDNGFSKAFLFNVTPIQDELKTLAEVSVPFGVTNSPIGTPNNTPTPTPTSNTQPTNTPTPTPTTVAVASPTPTPTSIAQATPTPTATSVAIGGDTGKTCNQACTSHSQCARNLMCYQGQCRLSTNPTNTSCVNPPDSGIQRSCNEYCADNAECGTGLTCWYNRCRNPQNVQSTTCAAPTTTSTGTGGTTTTGTTTTYRNTPTPTPRSVVQAPITTPAASAVAQPVQSPAAGEGFNGDFGTILDQTPAPVETEVEYGEPNPVVFDIPEDEPSMPNLTLIIGGLSVAGLVIAIIVLIASKLTKGAPKTTTVASNALEHPVTIPIKDEETKAPEKSSMTNFAGPTSVQHPGDRDDFKRELK